MMQQSSSHRLSRPSDGIIVVKQDYQFLLDQDSPYFGIPFNPLSAIVMTFHNTSSPNTKLQIVVQAFDVSYKVVSGGKGDNVEKSFKTSPEMGHLMPRNVKDATWALQHQFWVRLNKTNNTCAFFVGDISPFTKPLFEEKINPWAMPKKQLQRYAGQQAGQANGPGGKYEFQFNLAKISYFEGRHTTNQPTWVKWKVYQNNSKPLGPVLKEPGNFYSDEEHVPIIDYPHGIQHLYAMTKNKNLRDLAFMLKSSKINQSWEDVPAAIHYSLVTKQGKHYNKKPVGILNHLFRLKNKWEFKFINVVGRTPEDIMKQICEKRKAYIRFQTLAPDGQAPGSKMVLEIWPPHCCSIIHNHGEAFGVVKPLSGSIRVQNFHRLGFGNQNPFAEFTYHAGSFTWMSQHSYGVHRLINSFDQTCITIQSYFNGENTNGTFSVVGKGKFAFGEDEFLGQYTPQNDWQNYIKGLTAETQEDRQFIQDVIHSYGMKETGTVDMSFRKFCTVMRAEYENLNNMFNKIEYEGPSLQKNVNNLFGERNVGEVRSTVMDDKAQKSTQKTEAETKNGDKQKSNIKGASIREIQVYINNKLYAQAADQLKHTKDVNGVKEMVKNLRKNGKVNEVAKTAWILWEMGGDKLVYHAFGFENDAQADVMKVGAENKKAWLYYGELKNGKKHGKGKMIWSHGAKYEGTFKDDQREGQGIYYHSNGAKYTGQWSRDMKNGKGVFTYPQTGEKYEGEFKDNDKFGQGVYYYSDGSKYVGDWKYDLKDGKGVYFLENKDRYEGYWEKDAFHGKGIYYYANGKTKSKQYKHGKRV